MRTLSTAVVWVARLYALHGARADAVSVRRRNPSNRLEYLYERV